MVKRGFMRSFLGSWFLVEVGPMGCWPGRQGPLFRGNSGAPVALCGQSTSYARFSVVSFVDGVKWTSGLNSAPA
jgi:hypothetical protein